MLERSASETKMRGEKLEEEVEELIRVSQSLEVENQQFQNWGSFGELKFQVVHQIWNSNTS